MLVVDPEKRITMEEIKNHKWFKSNTNVLPEAFPVQVRQFPSNLMQEARESERLFVFFHSSSLQLASISDVDDIDTEIIANLMTLGWDTEKELIDAILSPE